MSYFPLGETKLDPCLYGLKVIGLGKNNFGLVPKIKLVAGARVGPLPTTVTIEKKDDSKVFRNYIKLEAPKRKPQKRAKKKKIRFKAEFKESIMMYPSIVGQTF